MMSELYIDKVTQKKRAISLDLARGSMLFLIILSHLPLLLYNIEPGVATKVTGSSTMEYILNYLMELIIDNRARPLFSILFGYGLVMIYRKQTERKGVEEAQRMIKRRSWYLILFGAILAGVAGGQDILMTYGISGLLFVSFLKKNNDRIKKSIILLSVLCLIYVPILWGVFFDGLQSYGFPITLNGQETYVSTIVDRLVAVFVTPLFTHILQPVIPTVLIGMWLGNLNILVKPHHHIKLLKRLTIGCLTISLVGAIPLVLINDVWFPDYFTAGVIYGVHIVTGFAGGMGYAALFGLLGVGMKYRGVIIKAITAMGKRSLTFFVIHEVLIVILLSPIAFNLGASLTITSSVLLGIVMWFTTLSIAYFMEQKQMVGPLEKYMRYLTYK